MHKLINFSVLGLVLLLAELAGCASPTVPNQTSPNIIMSSPKPLVATPVQVSETYRGVLAQREPRRQKSQPQQKYVKVALNLPKLHDSRGYIKQGTASWYRLNEHGAKTTSGQIYDLYGMTAAHASLPIPTRVRVKNLRTGRSVIVTVNDRLYYNSTLIKLSYWAARRLKLTKRPSQRIEVIGMK